MWLNFIIGSTLISELFDLYVPKPEHINFTKRCDTGDSGNSELGRVVALARVPR